jgi:DNA-binding MarR family transcriptional regulator
MGQREKLIEDIFQGLSAMRRAFFARGEHVSLKSGPTHAQLGIMSMLSHEALGVKDLALRFGMTSSAVTQFITNLSKQGYIVKTPDKTDRRKTCLRLTKKGERVLLKSKEERLKLFRDRLSRLSDEELLQLKKIQEKISV